MPDPAAFQLCLPATSANLGPGFDTVGLAMRLFLRVEASANKSFEIAATGRDAEIVGSLERNLMVDTYRDLAPRGPALLLTVRNEIPLGMGCGSSAAALLAGVLLADYFGKLGMTPDEILREACAREGHPDNVAACFLGGFTVSSLQGRRVTAATFCDEESPVLGWRLLLALPRVKLSTRAARALLPSNYPVADAIANLQATALLVSSFALARPELLREGTTDRFHQPYRAELCPLLQLLLPLAGKYGIYSVTLSGAGPAVLVIAAPGDRTRDVPGAIRKAAGDQLAELIETKIFVLPRGS